MVEEVNESGRKGANRMWTALAIVADVSAMVAIAASRTSTIVAVLGAVTLAVGVYHLTVRWGRPLHRRAALAIVTVVAGAVTLTVVVDRAVLEGSDESGITAGGWSHSGDGPLPTARVPGTIGPASSPPAASSTMVASPSASSSLSLFNTKPVEGGFIAGPLKVNGTSYEHVKSYELFCLMRGVMSDTYQMDRKYRVLRTQVGLGDESVSNPVVEFSVIVDGVTKSVESIRIGQIKPIDVDISGAFRVELRAEVKNPPTCSSPAFAAWIEPVVTG